MSLESEESLQRSLASEFSRRGWSYDLDTVPAILDDVRARGEVVPARAAQAVPRFFLDRNSTTRDVVARAIEAAIGGKVIAPSPSPVTIITTNDNRHQINVGGDVSNSALQTGGQQIVAQTTSPKEDILDAVSALVVAGINGHWDIAAAADLAEIIDARDDITMDDVRSTAAEVAGASDAESGRLKSFLNKIAAGGLGGALSTGIVAAIGALL
jgi:hypothetical protein